MHRQSALLNAAQATAAMRRRRARPASGECAAGEPSQGQACRDAPARGVALRQRRRGQSAHPRARRRLHHAARSPACASGRPRGVALFSAPVQRAERTPVHAACAPAGALQLRSCRRAAIPPWRCGCEQAAAWPRVAPRCSLRRARAVSSACPTPRLHLSAASSRRVRSRIELLAHASSHKALFLRWRCPLRSRHRFL